MPELPEVETTLRGITPHIHHQRVSAIDIRNPNLRWTIPSHLATTLPNQMVQSISRRGKYIIIDFARGAIILHLGMSGRLQVLRDVVVPKKHDHVDICFKNNIILRYTDPRRFGALLWSPHPVHHHPLLAHLGIEPLTRQFNGNYLFKHANKRKIPVKSLIMDNRIVVGVGNIYATEALFHAGISPIKPAHSIQLTDYDKLATAIKSILRTAIRQGGTTLKDFLQSDGKPGYFQVKLDVYGKEGTPCPRCGTLLNMVRINQRSTVYCLHCQ